MKKRMKKAAALLTCAMKHLIVWNVLVLFLCAPALAVDWDACRIEAQYGSAVVPLSDGRILVHHIQEFYGKKAPFADSLCVWKDGRQEACISLSDYSEQNPSAFSLPDGRFGVRVVDAENGRYALHLCSESGVESVPLWEGGNMPVVRSGFITLIDPRNNDMETEICTLSGERVMSCVLGAVYGMELSGDSFYFLGDKGVIRTSLTGEVFAKASIPSGTEQVFRMVSGIQDDVYALGRDADDYKVSHLLHFDAAGNLLFDRTVSAERIVLSADVVVCDRATGILTLYGRAVANSRKIYRVFKMELSPDGEMISCDVRDFGKPGTYNINVALSQDGVPYVWNDSCDLPGTKKGWIYAVPFEQLELAEDPGICVE